MFLRFLTAILWYLLLELKLKLIPVFIVHTGKIYTSQVIAGKKQSYQEKMLEFQILKEWTPYLKPLLSIMQAESSNSFKITAVYSFFDTVVTTALDLPINLSTLRVISKPFLMSEFHGLSVQWDNIFTIPTPP